MSSPLLIRLQFEHITIMDDILNAGYGWEEGGDCG
jgi:hypothetical protein